MNLYRQFTSQAELDAEYDVEAAVPAFGEYVDTFVRQSAQVRRELEHRLAVPYGPTLSEHLDVFPGEPGAPVLVFVHGGYWRITSSQDWSLVARGPRMAGWTVVVTNYTLAPAVSLTEIVRQHRAALSFVHQHAQDWLADRTRIVVAGHSAGGHAVAELLRTDWQREYGLPDDLVAGACSISGLFDLAPLPYTFVQPALQLSAQEVQRLSPMAAATSCSPPLVVAWGSEESAEFRRQSEQYAAHREQAGQQVTRLALPGQNHFDAVLGLHDPSSALCQAILALAPTGPQ